MKKIVTLLFIGVIMITGCTGDQGPVGPQGLTGPQGPQGPEGGIVVSSAFEIEIDFTTNNNYSHVEPYGFEVYDTDVTLVYILWENFNGDDVWRLLPQQVVFNDGTLVYNYDFTQTDVQFFLDGTKDVATLDSQWTENQVFRVVVIPADNVGIDMYDLDAVMQANNISSFEIK